MGKRVPRKRKEKVPPTTEEKVTAMARDFKSLGRELSDVKALLTTAMTRLATLGKHAKANGERSAQILGVGRGASYNQRAEARQEAALSRPVEAPSPPKLTPAAEMHETATWFKPLKVKLVGLVALSLWSVLNQGPSSTGPVPVQLCRQLFYLKLCFLGWMSALLDTRFCSMTDW